MITFNSLGRYGRLGNGMFQIASTIGIAIKNGYEYGFPEWVNYDHRDRFGSLEDVYMAKYFKNELPKCKRVFTNDRFIHWGFQGFDVPDNTSLSGHMQSEKYFEHCPEVIREVFKLREEFAQNNFIAIHVRLGDYDDHYHPRLGKEYYEKAMKEFPHETFILFSDDLDSAKKIFDFDIRTFKGSNYMEDFAMMKSCKGFIIGNSTFSWWPAWLGTHKEKKVVAPQKWFGEVAQLDNKDIYAKNWIVL